MRPVGANVYSPVEKNEKYEDDWKDCAFSKPTKSCVCGVVSFSGSLIGVGGIAFYSGFYSRELGLKIVGIVFIAMGLLVATLSAAVALKIKLSKKGGRYEELP